MQSSKRIKILVFSDSHGSLRIMKQAVALHTDADYIFHLGDLMRDATALGEETGRAVTCVPGNCDRMYGRISESALPASFTADLGGLRVFLCHGHTLGVKSGTGALAAEAQMADADIALFGHTHERFSLYLPSTENKPLYIFNPGSISSPRDGAPSYGIIECIFRGGRRDLLLSHGQL